MIGRKFRIKCGSRYFATKHGDNAIVDIKERVERLPHAPPTFLYQGRILAEGKIDMLHGTIYYGHVNGLGEFVHENELGEEVT